MAPFSIGIVGYGGFGRFLHRAWSEAPGATVVAVSSLEPMDGLERPADVVPDWRALVARGDLDAVAVTTPPHSHAEIGVAALEAGRHLIVEKPLATTLADADRLIAARDASARVAAVDLLLRYTPVAEALVGWAAEGPFGPLVRVALENEAQDASLPLGHWFWDREASGGILVEHGVHFFDLVNACVEASGGDPSAVAVSGMSRRRADGREDRVMATVMHRDGPLSTHSHAFTRPGAFERTTLRFTFALAGVDVDGWIPLSGTVQALASPAAEKALARLPGFALEERAASPTGPFHVGGEAYPPGALLRGRFVNPLSKQDAYAEAARQLLADVRRAASDPAHAVRASLEAGREALAQALASRDAADAQASQQARPQDS